MLLCKQCLQVLRNKGENISCDNTIFLCYDESEEMGKTCDWCEEIDDLYSCSIDNNIFESYNKIRELKKMEKVKTMSVWVVWRGCYTDRSIGKIFSDVKKAEDYANELGRNGSAIGEDVYIEEWSVE